MVVGDFCRICGLVTVLTCDEFAFAGNCFDFREGLNFLRLSSYESRLLCSSIPAILRLRLCMLYPKLMLLKFAFFILLLLVCEVELTAQRGISRFEIEFRREAVESFLIDSFFI